MSVIHNSGSAVITDIEEPEAEQLARTHRCAECGSRLSVAWGGYFGLNQYVLRCGKDVGHTQIEPNIKRRMGYHTEKGWIDMATETGTGLVRYETPLGQVELSTGLIRSYINPKATEEEAYFFLQKCRHQQLNPFAGEVYLVIYPPTERTPRTAQMIVGKRAHTRRAEQHPDFLGMESGLMLVDEDGKLSRRAGALVPPGHTLIGSWCQVKRRGKEPTYIDLTLGEYQKDNQFWKRMPATMIRKCAIVQALDEAFPGYMAGLQGSQEFELAADQETASRSRVVEGEVAFIEERDLAPDTSEASVPADEAPAYVPAIDEEVASEADVAHFAAMLDRDLDLLREPADLFNACFTDFKLQPPQVLKITGYSRAADLAGQNLQQLYWQVNETVREAHPPVDPRI